MVKVFRAWDLDQGWLLPPSLHEFVPPGHLTLLWQSKGTGWNCG